MRCTFSCSWFALVVALALVCSGCGKTQEQQLLETKLDFEIRALQKEVESNLAGFPELQAKLDATLEMHQGLVKKYAKRLKGHTADDLVEARKGLDTAKGEAESTLAAVTAYDNKSDHDKVMPILNREKESLMKVRDVVAGAVRAANAGVDNHEKMKSSLTAKTPAKAPAKRSTPKTRTKR